MSDILEILQIPFLICLVIAALHCYMGLHVIRRGVIFVDLALAQCAALGAAVALFLVPMIWIEEHQDHGSNETALTVTSEKSLADKLDLEGEEPPLQSDAESKDAASAKGHDEEHGQFTYCMSLLFALLGAVLLSVARFRDEAVPHEAIMRIIFVVCAALSVLILSKAPHGHERMEAMLIGSILFVSWADLQNMFFLYLALGLVHVVFARRFISISKNVTAAEQVGVRVKLWDCIFFASFALMVTQSVAVGGVLVVFSYLIIPAACGALFGNRFWTQLVIGWIVAVITTIAGLAYSGACDMPTGSSIVSSFGVALVICTVIRAFLKRRPVAGSGRVSPSHT